MVLQAQNYLDLWFRDFFAIETSSPLDFIALETPFPIMMGRPKAFIYIEP